MLDKNLIEKNFKKSINKYNNNAIIQKQMAEFLISKIQKKKHNKILEIGSYTGILTSLAIQKFEFNEYLALDIIDSFDYIKNLSPKITFKKTKIEDFLTDEKFDLIISNASLQWACDFEQTIKKLYTMLNNEGKFAVSVFGKQNLIEIKNVFNVGLKYYSNEEIKGFLPDCNIYSDIKQIKFENSIDILRHLKNTGVNSICLNKLSYKEIKEKLKILNSEYNNTITYNPMYIIN